MSVENFLIPLLPEKLPHFFQIYLSETIFTAGDTLKLDEHPNEFEIFEKCGLKGVAMLESIESLIGEKSMISKINEMIYNSKKGSYSSRTLYGLLNSTVDEDIYVSQVKM